MLCIPLSSRTGVCVCGRKIFHKYIFLGLETLTKADSEFPVGGAAKP